MSIVNQQLIGSGNLKAQRGVIDKNPFPKPPEWEGTPQLGFGGYTYAADNQQADVFGVDKTHVGPRWGYFAGAEQSTKYGGESGARPMEPHNTLLGQMAQFTDPNRHSRQDTWGTTDYSRKIAHSIMSNGQMRSLRETASTPTASPGRPIYHSSGGAFTGYDERNQYKISSWTTKAVEAVEAQPAVEAKAATMPSWHNRGMGSAAVAAKDAVEGTEGVEASNAEIFAATNNINTGLRSLPVSPTA